MSPTSAQSAKHCNTLANGGKIMCLKQVMISVTCILSLRTVPIFHYSGRMVLYGITLDWQLTPMRCFENTSDWFWKRDKPVGIFQLQGAVDKNMQSNYCETNDFHRISGALNYLKVLNENFETHPLPIQLHTVLFSHAVLFHPQLAEIHQQQQQPWPLSTAWPRLFPVFLALERWPGFTRWAIPTSPEWWSLMGRKKNEVTTWRTWELCILLITGRGPTECSS